MVHSYKLVFKRNFTDRGAFDGSLLTELSNARLIAPKNITF